MLTDIVWDLGASAVNLRWYVFGALIATAICQDVFNAAYLFWNRPRGIRIVGPSILFGKWWSSLRFIIGAPQLIEKGYKQSNSAPFAIPARESYLVFVTSEEHVREVENSPQDRLSFHKAMEDRLKLKHTFNGFETGPVDPHDSVPIRVLKTLLRMDIPQLRPKLQERIEETFDSCISHGKPILDGWTRISAFHFAEELSLRVNCRVIFGDNLANNEDFVQVAQKYHRQAVVAMLTSHYLPNWTDEYAVPGMMALGGAMKKVDNFLTAEVKRRLQDMQDGKKNIPRDGITWVIEASTGEKQQTVKRLVQQIFAIFFASAHQLPVLLMFAMYRLCEHPQYMSPLTKEVEDMLRLPEADHYKHLPLLESFLREAARYDPLDSLSVQRKVLRDFTFSDGSYVPAGNVICVPQQAVMRDARYYDRPNEFLPFRFVANQEEIDDVANQKFTDLKPHFYLWGAAKNPWQ
ncbi:hypothetical protein MMC29_002163, partial [Sticta canariensis]|nr:hypothetical protein [Sticta canariensis]